MAGHNNLFLWITMFTSFFFTYRVGCLFCSITTDSLTHLTVRKE